MTSVKTSTALLAALGVALSGLVVAAPSFTASSALAAPGDPCPTGTATAPPADTPTATISATPTATASPTDCATPTSTATTSATPTATTTTTATATSTTTATTTATSTATSTRTATATTTSTATNTGGPPATPPGCLIAATRINTRTINATGLASVTVSNVRPGTVVELQGYSQDHFLTQNFANDRTPVDRTAVADANGNATFSNLRLSSNTRVRARQRGCAFGNSGVINVRAQETLQVVRNGTRVYTFSGRSIPARPGGLIVSLYRIVGTPCAAGVEPRNCPGEVLIGQDRAEPLGAPGEGLYSIRKAFPASDANRRVNFVVKTGQDAQNAPGRSNVRNLLIF